MTSDSKPAAAVAATAPEPAAEPGPDAAAAVERIRAIVLSPQAAGCLMFAVQVALNTTLAVPEAIELLAAAVPAPPQPVRIGRLN